MTFYSHCLIKKVPINLCHQRAEERSSESSICYFGNRWCSRWRQR